MTPSARVNVTGPRSRGVPQDPPDELPGQGASNGHPRDPFRVVASAVHSTRPSWTTRRSVTPLVRSQALHRHTRSRATIVTSAAGLRLGRIGAAPWPILRRAGALGPA